MISKIKKKILLPNLLSILLLYFLFLGTSKFDIVRYLVLSVILFTFLLYKYKFNKPNLFTFFLLSIILFYLISYIIKKDFSSLYLFKNFAYLLLFDFLIRDKIVYNKYYFNSVLIFSILVVTFNLASGSDYFGVYSTALGFPRVYHISMITLTLFFLFGKPKHIISLIILFISFITFSAASYLIIFINFFKKKIFLLLIFLCGIFFIINQLESIDLYNQVLTQKEKSFENKYDDASDINNIDNEDVSEILSVEMYRNSGILVSFLFTIFIILYIKLNSNSNTFTLFSFIIISSNPFPLLILMIVGNLLKNKISKNDI